MRRLLSIAAIAFIAASLAIYLFGDSGVFALSTLARYERSLAANVEALQERNRELTAELAGVSGDPEGNRVLARGIGLYGPGEEVVRLEGRQSRPTTYAIGDLVRMRQPEGGASAVLKTVAAAVAAGCAVLAFLAARGPRRRTHGGPGR
jgi:hypothetical protein